MFSFGSGVKKDRGTGFSVLAAREMKRERKREPPQEPPPPRSFTCSMFRAVSDSRSLNHTETLAMQARASQEYSAKTGFHTMRTAKIGPDLRLNFYTG